MCKAGCGHFDYLFQDVILLALMIYLMLGFFTLFVTTKKSCSVILLMKIPSFLPFQSHLINQIFQAFWSVTQWQLNIRPYITDHDIIDWLNLISYFNGCYICWFYIEIIHSYYNLFRLKESYTKKDNYCVEC